MYGSRGGGGNEHEATVYMKTPSKDWAADFAGWTGCVCVVKAQGSAPNKVYDVQLLYRGTVRCRDRRVHESQRCPI
jgi:hypothetical protein